ncbi:MAG: alpha-L-fucosidase [Prevotellaceae bacterium]|jgi:alpha-L-fucosidase|nr:alpha-L-fucosidase [Prevotellaceae bacterium]
MRKIRTFLILALVNMSIAVFAQNKDLPMTEGKYKPTDESLKQYKYPAWFRDAKFGIWSHWGPQAVPRQGDWYARGMYERGYYDCAKEKYRKPHPYYTYHTKNYGHPSEFGYKDIIPLWKAERWNPDELMKLYKRVGAKYFVSMGTHHDNFFLWNSKLHKWNSVNMGPKKDVVGLWQQAAKKEGLYFGVSEHLGASYTWFQTSHKSDQLGDKAGVPYDGNNPEYQDLYHAQAEPDDKGWLTKNPVWQRQWYDRIRELIDNYNVDLLYSDSGLPFEDVGRTLIAHYYNSDLKAKGKGVIYTCKQTSDGRWVHDRERGVAEGISEYPWQTDTSIGDWYYRTGQKYMTGPEVIQMLVDIVSKNGNLLLNIVQTPEGDLEQDVLDILENIATWMQDNGSAIYGTRPWKVYGEGPSVSETQEKSRFGGLKDVRKYQSTDLRFTLKGKILYTFCMEGPTEDIHIKSLGLKTETGAKISSIKMLGSEEKISWIQNDDEAVIRKPAQLPAYNTVVFAVKLK